MVAAFAAVSCAALEPSFESTDGCIYPRGYMSQTAAVYT